MHSYFIKSAIC